MKNTKLTGQTLIPCWYNAYKYSCICICSQEVDLSLYVFKCHFLDLFHMLQQVKLQKHCFATPYELIKDGSSPRYTISLILWYVAKIIPTL